MRVEEDIEEQNLFNEILKAHNGTSNTSKTNREKKLKQKARNKDEVGVYMHVIDTETSLPRSDVWSDSLWWII